jgi:hypothetical protein
MGLAMSIDSFAAGEKLLGRRAPDGWGPGSSYAAMYDAASVTTVTGTVRSISTFKPDEGRYSGVQVGVSTRAGTYVVHLGPEWFIVNQDFELNEGDKVEVKGASVTYKGVAAIMASHLKKFDSELILRDEDGVPYWEAYRRRGGARR